MPTYLGRLGTRMDFLSVLFGLILLRRWMFHLLIPSPRSHDHRTRMGERVSVPCDLVVELNPIDLFVRLQRFQTILQLRLAVQRIPPDQSQTRMNPLLLPILMGLRNQLRFLGCVAPIS